MTEQGQRHRRRASDRIHLAPIVWAFIALTFIFFGTVVGFAWVVHDVNDNSKQLTVLVAENQNRIKDIQASRTDSCEQTYEGIRQVVLTFFVQPPPRSAEVDQRVIDFNTLIDKYVTGCKAQTKP